MRSLAVVAVAACLVATVACHSTRVRGPEGTAFTATTPAGVYLRRGESAPLVVDIDRENFQGKVNVTVSQLPKGVSVDRSTQTVETQQATFALKAANDATLVSNQAVRITVTGLNGRSTTQYVDLSVVQ
jgi:hypothetical protein